MNFIIESLDYKHFEYLSKLSDVELKQNNIVKQIVDKKPSFPCRITLEDAEIGEEVFLLNYEFHAVNSPYKASGPIYIRPNKAQKICEINEVPSLFLTRLISLRGYNEKQMLIFAEVFDGKELKEKIQYAFGNQTIEYLHIHNARFGCYFAQAKRAK